MLQFTRRLSFLLFQPFRVHFLTFIDNYTKSQRSYLTFFYKRYKFAHLSFLLYLDGFLGKQLARPLTLFTAFTCIVSGAKLITLYQSTK